MNFPMVCLGPEFVCLAIRFSRPVIEEKRLFQWQVMPSLGHKDWTKIIPQMRTMVAMVLVYLYLHLVIFFGQMLVCIFQHHGSHLGPEMGVKKRPCCELPPKTPPGCAIDPLDPLARGKVQLGLPLILWLQPSTATKRWVPCTEPFRLQSVASRAPLRSLCTEDAFEGGKVRWYHSIMKWGFWCPGNVASLQTMQGRHNI